MIDRDCSKMSRSLEFTVEDCFVRCDFSKDRVGSNDDSAVKLSEDEEDDWHSL
jgi:hypothetical protein